MSISSKHHHNKTKKIPARRTYAALDRKIIRDDRRMTKFNLKITKYITIDDENETKVFSSVLKEIKDSSCYSIVIEKTEK
jgi:hypothetical protein